MTETKETPVVEEVVRRMELVKAGMRELRRNGSNGKILERPR